MPNQIYLKSFDRRFIDDSRGVIISSPSACPLSLSWGGVKSKFTQVYKKYGWKAVAGIVGYYLIRDVTLYIVLPYALIAGN